MHLLEDDYDIQTIRELLGYKDVCTTMIYTYVLNRGRQGARSPLDGVLNLCRSVILLSVILQDSHYLLLQI